MRPAKETIAQCTYPADMGPLAAHTMLVHGTKIVQNTQYRLTATALLNAHE